MRHTATKLDLIFMLKAINAWVILIKQLLLIKQKNNAALQSNQDNVIAEVITVKPRYTEGVLAPLVITNLIVKFRYTVTEVRCRIFTYALYQSSIT